MNIEEFKYNTDMTLTESVNVLKSFTERVGRRYNRNLGSPYYFFMMVAYGLMNGNPCIEDFVINDDFEKMKNNAKVMYVTYNMSCPSKRKNLWRESSTKEDLKLIISIVKSIRDS